MLKSIGLLYGVARCLALAFVLANIVEVAAEEPIRPGPADANNFVGLQTGLSNLPLLGQGRTRSISPENPTGEKGKGAMGIPDPTQTNSFQNARAADKLGQGWKVNPFIRINAGETKTIMDVEGPGIIQHIWMVEGLNRGLVIRFYWDDEESPSIESPVPDFFAVGHGKFAPVHSATVVVVAKNALNCYWPMPFRKHAKITLSNETTEDIKLVTYQITYAETEVSTAAGYFHAQYRRASTAKNNPYVILDGVKGQGRYVGTFLAYTQLEKGWFGEGEIKFFMDGDDQFPTICGTGMEDYFLGSYGLTQVYTAPYSGNLLPANAKTAEPPQFWSIYRWHILDPINFDQDLRVTLQALGWQGNRYKKMSDDISSVAYWYQSEPHAPFPKLPSVAERQRVARPSQAQSAAPANLNQGEIKDP